MSNAQHIMLSPKALGWSSGASLQGVTGTHRYAMTPAARTPYSWTLRLPFIRHGRMLIWMAEDGERASTRGVGLSAEVEPKPTLADLGITKEQSSDRQAIFKQQDAVRDWAKPAEVVTPKRAARVARDAEAKAARDAAPAPVLSATCSGTFGWC